MGTVYLNGSYLPAEEARVPVGDRGFLFGDGLYEVVPAYGGTFFLMEEHLARLRRGLRALRIDYDASEVPAVSARLLAENGLIAVDAAIVYLQVTRGVAPRTHAFPTEAVEPTVYGFAKEYVRPPRERWERGYAAVTVPDRRWSRVDIKSIQLLPNVLAQQAAVDAGVADALFVRDGVALEGAHNNVWAVFDGSVVTHPATHQILHGVTRAYVLELCCELGLPVEERPIPVEDLRHADEIFFTGTTTEVRPTVELDGRAVGDGRVGPVTRRLFDAFLDGIARATATPSATGSGESTSGGNEDFRDAGSTAAT